MDTFNLRKFLKENQITTNPKPKDDHLEDDFGTEVPKYVEDDFGTKIKVREELTSDKVDLLNAAVGNAELKAMLSSAIDLYNGLDGLEGIESGDIMDYINLKLESAIAPYD